MFRTAIFFILTLSLSVATYAKSDSYTKKKSKGYKVTCQIPPKHAPGKAVVLKAKSKYQCHKVGGIVPKKHYKKNKH